MSDWQEDADFDPSPDDPHHAPLPFFDDEAEMLERPTDDAGCTCDECDEDCPCADEGGWDCGDECSCTCADRREAARP